MEKQEKIREIENEIGTLTFNHRVSQAQQEIVAPKIHGGNGIKYKYRSCEQILEACKPVLKKYHLLLVLNDEIVTIGSRFYVKATARVIDTMSGENNFIESVAYAREDDSSRNMATSQLTGSSSSYARKYALSGLFLLDDNKDADRLADENSQNENGKENKDDEPASDEVIQIILESFSDNSDRLSKALAWVACDDISHLTAFQAQKILKALQVKEVKAK